MPLAIYTNSKKTHRVKQPMAGRPSHGLMPSVVLRLSAVAWCDQHVLHAGSNAYTGVDSVACIQLQLQLWSLHEQFHQLRGWGVVYLLYLLACALQYRHLSYMLVVTVLRPCNVGIGTERCMKASKAGKTSPSCLPHCATQGCLAAARMHSWLFNAPLMTCSS
jgi:hypothetical protein